MSFEHEVEQVIEEVGLARDRFDDEWETARQAIYAVFKRVAPLFEKSQWINGGQAKIKNGEVALNAVKDLSGDFIHTLGFSPKRDAREVVCTATTGEPEYYSIDKISQREIEKTVIKFARAVARNPYPDPGY